MNHDLEIISLLDEAKPNYKKIWDLQKSLIDSIAQRTHPEAIIFCEHEPVITLGRRSHANNILDHSIPAFEIERGGDVTYHGPGQLVVYPLLRLNGNLFTQGLHEFLRMNETVMINVLSELGLDAGRFGPTGVWIKTKNGLTKKIASLGISVRRWVTYHGIAVNVTNALENFSSIRPCDFDASIMTSLQEQGIEISLPEMRDLLVAEYSKHLMGLNSMQLSRTEKVLAAAPSN